MIWLRPPVPARDGSAAPRSRVGRLAISAAIVLATVLLSPNASAQSPGDLRRENDRLRQLVDELQAEVSRLRTQLTAAEEAVATLQARVTELESAGAGAGASPEDRSLMPPGGAAGEVAGEPGVVTVDESRPEGSPRAVRAEARRRWAEGPGRLDLGLDAASPQRINYLRVLESWAREQDRTWRVEVEWIVEPLSEGATGPTGTTWTMQARDPVTDARIGDPFVAHARSGIVRSLERERARAIARGESAARLRLFGRVLMRFTVDPTRREPGPFDRGRALAPFLNFEFGVEASRMLVAPPPPPPPAPTPTPAEDAGASPPPPASDPPPADTGN